MYFIKKEKKWPFTSIFMIISILRWLLSSKHNTPYVCICMRTHNIYIYIYIYIYNYSKLGQFGTRFQNLLVQRFILIFFHRRKFYLISKGRQGQNRPYIPARRDDMKPQGDMTPTITMCILCACANLQ